MGWRDKGEREGDRRGKEKDKMRERRIGEIEKRKRRGIEIKRESGRENEVL
jgi:hypothetical protein